MWGVPPPSMFRVWERCREGHQGWGCPNLGWGGGNMGLYIWGVP